MNYAAIILLSGFHTSTSAWHSVMTLAKKTRIPSVPYLEKKITELSAIANPAQDDIMLLGHYRKLMKQCSPAEQKPAAENTPRRKAD